MKAAIVGFGISVYWLIEQAASIIANANAHLGSAGF